MRKRERERESEKDLLRHLERTLQMDRDAKRESDLDLLRHLERTLQMDRDAALVLADKLCVFWLQADWVPESVHPADPPRHRHWGLMDP